MTKLSYFDEKSGIVYCITKWGRWSQTVSDVNIEVDLPEQTRGKDVVVKLESIQIRCAVLGNTIFEGKLFGPVKQKEMIWSIEDKKVLRIALVKADASVKESVWTSLLADNYEIPKDELKGVKEKLDLERFQLENPQYNFANWKEVKYNYPISIPITGDTAEDMGA